MEKPQITAYLKTYCGWSAGVRAVLNKYNLPYTAKEIIANPAFRWEMETKSGQPLSPCVEISEKMLADVSGEEVEQYRIENELVKPSETVPEVPLNAPCATEQHESNVQLNFCFESARLWSCEVLAPPPSHRRNRSSPTVSSRAQARDLA